MSMNPDDFWYQQPDYGYEEETARLVASPGPVGLDPQRLPPELGALPARGGLPGGPPPGGHHRWRRRRHRPRLGQPGGSRPVEHDHLHHPAWAAPPPPGSRPPPPRRCRSRQPPPAGLPPAAAGRWRDHAGGHRGPVRHRRPRRASSDTTPAPTTTAPPATSPPTTSPPSTSPTTTAPPGPTTTRPPPTIPDFTIPDYTLPTFPPRR